MYTPDQPLNNPEWEMEDAYNAAWREASPGDELYDNNLQYRFDLLLDSATWDDETKHDFAVSLPLHEMTNGELSDVNEYLLQYQPRTPFSEVKNPTQKQINAFVRKVCNL